jgi:branched-chain amino acid transport system permease protein
MLAVEQCLNALQFGLILFLISAGLTLVFGIMDVINLTHGSLYMVGAFVAATATRMSGSLLVGIAAAVVAVGLTAVVLEAAVIRRVFGRDHMSQVLATFAVMLVMNDTARMIWGPEQLLVSTPAWLSGGVPLLPGFRYSAYRLLIIAVGIAAAGLLYVLIEYTRAGQLVRASASNPEMARLMGTDVDRLFKIIFVLGGMLAGLAGALLGPIFAVQVGMGDDILIMAFVTIVIGGLGSVRGAFVGSLIVAAFDTFGRAALPPLLRITLPADVAGDVGPMLASISIYIAMAGVLLWKPQGLFSVTA